MQTRVWGKNLPNLPVFDGTVSFPDFEQLNENRCDVCCRRWNCRYYICLPLKQSGLKVALLEASRIHGTTDIPQPATAQMT